MFLLKWPNSRTQYSRLEIDDDCVFEQPCSKVRLTKVLLDAKYAGLAKGFCLDVSGQKELVISSTTPLQVEYI